MKVRFRTSRGSILFNGHSPAALALVQVLEQAPRRKGLRVLQIIGHLTEKGVLFKSNENSVVRQILRQLSEIGACGHPRGAAAGRAWVLLETPRIAFIPRKRAGQATTGKRTLT